MRPLGVATGADHDAIECSIPQGAAMRQVEEFVCRLIRSWEKKRLPIHAERLSVSEVLETSFGALPSVNRASL